MSKLNQIQTLLAELTPAEKAQLLAALRKEIYPPDAGISRTPGVCGGRACIRATRIPVWTIIEARRLGLTDVRLLQNFQGLTAEDIVNAQRYYETHRAEIEADLADQA